MSPAGISPLKCSMSKGKVYFATWSQRQHFPDLLLLIISNTCLHDCFCQPTLSCHQPPQNIIINTLHTHKGVTGKGLGAPRGLEHKTHSFPNFLSHNSPFHPTTTCRVDFQVQILLWIITKGFRKSKGKRKKQQECVLAEYIHSVKAINSALEGNAA